MCAGMAVDGHTEIGLVTADAEISALAAYDVAQVEGGVYSNIHAPVKPFFEQSFRIDGSLADPMQKPNQPPRHDCAEKTDPVLSG